MMRKVALLLSTYNGEKYINELLTSLINQSYQDYWLYIRDDGSTDKTPFLIKQFSENRENVIFINERNRKNLGIIQSFSQLLKIALQNKEIDYFMFVDQDDIWLPHKVEYSLTKIQEMERENGASMPLLFHTDLEVVDENLKVINKSFWEYQKLDPKRSKLHQLLVQNNVTGCAAIINRSLAERVVPIPLGAIMHDRWIALAAAAFGKIGWSKEVTIQYRQHSKNSVGAKKLLSLKNMYRKISEPNVIGKTVTQAEIFFEKYKQTLSNHDKMILEQYILLKNANRLKRLEIVFRHHLYKNGWLRNLGMIYLLLRKKEL